MRALNRVVGCCTIHGRAVGRGMALAATLLAAGLAFPAALYPHIAASASAAAPAAAASPAGGCSYQLINGGYRFVCTSTSATGGGPGSGGGSGGKPACTLTPLSQQQAAFLGLQWPPAKNHTWDAITCPGSQPFGGVILVDHATGVPPISPAELAQIAIGDLIIPQLRPRTAPPRGHDGLVGLPEWFWIPGRDWGAVQTPPVRAGTVWAIATAVPTKIIFDPGGGLAGITCNGPGTAYQPKVPLSAQHTDCSYTYDQPSAGQPGNAYAASVTVLWNVSWIGSGDAGGPVATGRPVSTPIAVPVAAGEALVTSG
jgi:hypothetical protein